MAIKPHKDLVLAKGSLILVTGATGYIAANLVKEALDAGYRVRGTARTQEKADKSQQSYQTSDYEVVVVPEMEPEGAFDEAVKGVDAIIHTASPVTFSPNPKEVVQPALNGATSILNSAIKEPKVKRFVLTSSSVAATLAKPGKKFKIDKTTWNNEVDEFADYPPPYTEDKAMGVYAASKKLAEEAVWKFVADKKPQFVVNCVLPNFNIGRLMGQGGLTSNVITSAYDGNVNWGVGPQHMINVIDDARLHLAAAIDGSLANERIFAFDSPFNWNDILDIMRTISPDRTFPENRDLPRDLSEVDNKLGAELLKKWWGQEGYTGLEESIKQNLQGLT